MSLEVALIDFPRLQEQIATRLLSEFQANIHRLTHREAVDRMSMFNLALFFWPDCGADSAERLAHLRQGGAGVKVAIVTSEAGKRNAQALTGMNSAADILVTPLQPHVVSRQLAALLGRTREDPGRGLRADYLNPFVEATVDTLKQMARMECTRTGLSLRTDAATRGFISGTMGLSGTAEGFISVTFNDALARRIVCQMLQISSRRRDRRRYPRRRGRIHEHDRRRGQGRTGRHRLQLPPFAAQCHRRRPAYPRPDPRCACGRDRIYHRRPAV